MYTNWTRALALAMLAAGSSAAVRAEDLEKARTDLLTPTFERTYVLGSSLGGEDPSLIFEANIAPSFYLFLQPRWQVVLMATPKVVLRMSNAASSPVRTPSYMPRVTGYWAFQPWGRRARLYATGTISHHSNGQEGPFLLADGSVNHETGSFSTNFVEWSGTAVLERAEDSGGLLRKFFYRNTTLRLGWEFHPRAWSDEESTRGYSPTRIHTMLGYQLVRPADERRGSQELMLTWMISYLGGDLSEGSRGAERWASWSALTYTPPWSPDVAFMLNHFAGPDYYNSFYRDYRQFFRAGICVNRGQAYGPGGTVPAPY